MKALHFVTAFGTVFVLAGMLASCKEKMIPADNPLFAGWDTPFGVPPFNLIEPAHYLPAFEAAMEAEIAQIDSIANNTAQPDFTNTILALDRSGEMLERVSNLFFLLTAAETNEAMQDVQRKVSPLLAQHRDRILLNEKLFQRVKSLHERKSQLPLDADRQQLLEKTYRRFVRSGALLSEREKKRLQEVNEKLAGLSVQFGNNVLAETKGFRLEVDSAGIAGIPAHLLTQAQEAARKAGVTNRWVFTLDKSSLFPFLTYSERRDLREEIYRGYLDRGSRNNTNDNRKIANEIVQLRTERAKLLGFETHAAFVLDDVMAQKPENVYALLDALWQPALKRATDELNEMKALRLKETGEEDFASWDWWFYAEKVRKQQYNLDEEMLRPYFQLENVRNGIFMLCNRLFGITFRPVVLPLYHSGVKTYEVRDIDNSTLGVLYLDFFPREGKQPGAWCGCFRASSYDAEGNRIVPIVSIVCNFTPPGDRRPSLLSLEEVETFFHEFGHALHALFTKVRYKALLEVERDFVELPSQIMENWVCEPDVLRQYAIHHQAGSVIPDHLVDKIGQSRLFNQGFATLEYLAASYSDMDIHNDPDVGFVDLHAFEQEILNGRRNLIPEIEPRYRYPYFLHIFDNDYSAGYYSYIWAEVLDKDAFQAFVETGDIFNRSVARSFRADILERGGAEEGMTLYKNFRGKEPSRLPLLRKRGLVEDEREDEREVERSENI